MDSRVRGNDDGAVREAGRRSGPSGLPKASPAPSASASVAPDQDTLGDLTEAQRGALKTLRAAMHQRVDTWGPEIREVIDKIKRREISFGGLTRGDLIRALGDPPEEPWGAQPSPNMMRWAIGVEPPGLRMNPENELLEFDLGDDGRVVAAGFAGKM